MTLPANRIESFAIATAVNHPSSNPVVTDVSFQDGIVNRIEIDVPPGHNGLTGIQILSSHGQLFPFTFGAYFVANDHQFGWDTVGLIDTGFFQTQTYNSDVFIHTHYVRFFVLDFAYAESPAAIPQLAPTPLLV